MARDEQLLVRLTEKEKDRLEATLRKIRMRTGENVTMSDLVRDLLEYSHLDLGLGPQDELEELKKRLLERYGLEV